MEASGGSVFINYRVGDQSSFAALLAKSLEDKIGKGEVFFISESTSPGDVFDDEILAAVRRCAVLIAVIGPRWLDFPGSDGRKLDNPSDWVRREIVEALRLGKRVVPVLVEGTSLPGKGELPMEMADLARRQYRRIGHRDSREEVDRLVEELIREEPALQAICLPGTRRLDDWWNDWSGATEPPLPAAVLLAGREAEASAVIGALSGEPGSTAVRCESAEYSAAFIAATLVRHTYPYARSLVVTEKAAWPRCVAMPEPCVLVPLFDFPDLDVAVGHGHQVLVPLHNSAANPAGAEVRLPDISISEACSAFEDAGVPPAEAQAYALASRKSLALLRKHLTCGDESEPDTIQPRLASDQGLLPYVVLRGPLRQLQLLHDVTSADELVNSEPERAAALYEKVAARLSETKFAVHEAPVRAKQAAALAAAGRHDEAFLAVLAVLWERLADGGQSEEVDPLLHQVPEVTRLRPDLARAAKFILATPNVASGYVPVSHELTSAFDELRVEDPYRLQAAVWLCEQAIASRAHEVIEERLDALRPLALSVEEPGSAGELDVARLSMCLADVTGEWDSVLHRLKRFDPWCTPWFYARRARSLTLANELDGAALSYEQAISDATSEGMNVEAADWLYSLRVVQSKRGVVLAEGDLQHPLAQHLRNLERFSRLPGSPTLEERALRSLRANSPRGSLSLLTRWRWKACVRGDLVGELEATRELGLLQAEVAEPATGLRDLVWAEAKKKAVEVAKALPDKPVRWVVASAGTTADQRDAALDVVAACGDLVPDEEAQAWVPVALDGMHGRGPRRYFSYNDPALYGTRALAALAPCLTEEQAEEALDVVAPRVEREPNQYYQTDAAHAKLLVGIAVGHAALADRAVGQLVDGLPVNDDFAHKAVGGIGLELLRARESWVSQTLLPFARQGNHWACVALALLDRKDEVLVEHARQGAESVIARPDPTPFNMPFWAGHDALMAMAHLLEEDVQERLAAAIFRHALNQQDDPSNRRNALKGLGKLATLFSDSARRELFDAVFPLARGEGDGGPGSEMAKVAKHPLSAIRMNLSPNTCADAALLACALMAVTEEDRFMVREQSLRLLSVDPEVDVPTIVTALNSVTSSAEELPPALLATHAHPHVRGLAALLWAGAPTDSDLGLALAKSPYRVVRSALAGALTTRSEHRQVADLLRADPRRSVRNEVARKLG